jgi:hypothetical protein
MKSPFNQPLRGIRSPFGATTGNGLRVTAPALYFLSSAQPYTVTGAYQISLSDSDAAGGTYGLAATISDGDIAFSGTTGLTGDTTGTDGTLNVTGSLTNINNALNNLVISTATAGSRTITYTFTHAATSRSVVKVCSVIVGVVVANSVAPVISGTLNYGNVLTVSDGTWTGTPAPTYTYQWQKNGTNISGQTASTYTTVFGDVGATITCEVTGANPFNSVMAEATGVVILDPAAPNLTAPVLDWDDDTADTTPDFTCTITNPLVGDTLTLQLYSDSGLTTLVDSAVNTLDAGEVTAEQADFALAALSAGTYYARVLFERTGWTSTYSNTVTVTISTISAKAIQDRAAAYILDRAAAYIETRV